MPKATHFTASFQDAVACLQPALRRHLRTLLRFERLPGAGCISCLATGFPRLLLQACQLFDLKEWSYNTASFVLQAQRLLLASHLPRRSQATFAPPLWELVCIFCVALSVTSHALRLARGTIFSVDCSSLCALSLSVCVSLSLSLSLSLALVGVRCLGLRCNDMIIGAPRKVVQGWQFSTMGKRAHSELKGSRTEPAGAVGPWIGMNTLLDT